MISKRMLTANIIGQLIIFSAGIISFISNIGVDRMEHNMIMISFIFLFWIGLWQLVLSILEVVIYKNKIRKKYLIFVAAFVGSLLFGIAISPLFPSDFDSPFLAYLSGFYFFGSCLAFIVWYFRQTLRDLKQD
jgi:hypothetical protein